MARTGILLLLALTAGEGHQARGQHLISFLGLFFLLHFKMFSLIGKFCSLCIEKSLRCDVMCLGWKDGLACNLATVPDKVELGLRRIKKC